MTSQEYAASFETVQAYIDNLNKDSIFTKLADAAHFEDHFSITTPAALEEHLFWDSFSDICKIVNGVPVNRADAEAFLAGV